MSTIIFATKNKNKLIEINKIMENTGYKIIAMDDNIDVIEDGETFEANAIKKAEEIMKATNAIVMADDSGLEIDYLNKAPGVQSARYLGEKTPYDIKNAHIIELLKNASDRTARFVCVIALASPSFKTICTRGVIEGTIAHEQRGKDGFGYDPIFYLPEFKKTMAELSLEQKNIISHRGRALEEMKICLNEKKIFSTF